MKKWKEYYQADIYRYGKSGPNRWTKKYLYYLRKSSMCDIKIMSYYYRFRYRMMCRGNGIEIPHKTNIGKGLYILHPYNITINGDAILGNSIGICKGATIGQENRGKRKGTPTIGNNVWIGLNAVIVGNITIGEDVFIAPNAFVNVDVPSHSIVVGNPCVITHKENATETYNNNLV